MPLIVGEPVTLECVYEGIPTPRAVWSRHGNPLQDGNRYIILNTEATGHTMLRLRMTFPEDLGEYTCTVTNDCGEAISIGHLVPEAEYQQQLAQEAQRQREMYERTHKQEFVSELETTMHRRRTSSESPAPQQRATRRTSPGPLPMRASPVRMMRKSMSPKPLVSPRHISPGYLLSGSVDSVFYDASPSSYESQILVEVDLPTRRPKIATEIDHEGENVDSHDYKGEIMPPLIVQQLKDFQLTEGQDAAFFCKVAGVPRPKVVWFKNGERLKASSRFTMKYSTDGYHTLRIRDTNVSDEGVYMIHAVNAGGSATSVAQLYIDTVKAIDTESFISPKTLSFLQKREQSRDRKREIVQSGIVEKAFRPIFKSIPHDQEAREGACIRFDCVVSAKPTAEVQWFRNGQLVLEDQQHKIVVNENGINSMIIKSVHAQDGGQYTCVAHNKAGHAEFSINLTVLEREHQVPPKFTERIQPKDVTEGQNIVLTCAAVGSPEPRIAWTKDNKYIHNGPKHTVVTEYGRSQLTIHDAGPSDAGWYQCSAVSVAGSATTRAKVSVEQAPAPDRQESKLYIPKAKHSVIPPPDATVVDAPDLGMHRPSMRRQLLRTIQTDETVQKETVHSSKLQISPSVRDDHQFRVVPKMEDNVDSQDIYNPNNPMAPFFRKHPTSTLVKEGHPVRFDCLLVPVGDPDMHVEWYCDGQLVKVGHRFHIRHEWSYVSLDILYCYPEDSGEYVCVAKNRFGRTETTPAVLRVKPKQAVILDTQFPEGTEGVHKLQEMEEHWSEISQFDIEALKEAPKEKCAPFFDVGPQPVTVDEGDCAKFIVRVSGFPRPKITWRINNTIVVSSSRFTTHYDGHIYYLEIPKVREYDQGIVHVTAVNQLGTAETSTELVVNPKEDLRLALRHQEQPVDTYEVHRRKIVELRSSRPEVSLVQTPRMTVLQIEKEAQHRANMFRKAHEGSVDAERLYLQQQSSLRHSEASFELRDHSPTIETRADVYVDKATYKLTGQVEEKIYSEKPMPVTLQKKLAPPTTTEESLPVEVKSSIYPVPIPQVKEDLPKLKPAPQTAPKPLAPSSALQLKEELPKLKSVESTAPPAPPKPIQPQLKDDLPKLKPVDSTPPLVSQKPVQPQLRDELPKLKPVESAAPPTQPKPKQPVAQPPSFTRPLVPVKVTEGQPVTLEVEFEGFPPPQITWYKASFEIRPSQDFQIRTEGSRSELHLPEVLPDDHGMYMVKAYNQYGMMQCKAMLVVQPDTTKPRETPPQFITKLQDVKATVGEPISFTIQLDQQPTQNYKVEWYKNTKLLTVGPRYKFINDKQIFTLLIIEVTPEDAGLYEVVVSNPAGVSRCTSQLIVQLPMKPRPAPQPTDDAPKIREPLTSTSVKEGQSTKLTCRISGNPVVTWLCNGQLIKKSKYFDIKSEGDVHSLTIAEAFPEDEGEYVVTAKNSTGEVTTTANLKVISTAPARVTSPVIPEVSGEPPRFLQPISSLDATEGDKIVFEAVVMGEPTPSVAWFRENEQINSSLDFQITVEDNRHRLIIPEAYPEDSGLFTCKAQNEFGIAECTAELYVEEHKDEPQEVKPPAFETPLRPSASVVRGETAELTCIVDAYPPPKSTWLFNGREIRTSQKYIIKEEARRLTLRILDVQPQDSGEYTLTVENEYGDASCTTTLNVLPSQKEVELPGSRVVQTTLTTTTELRGEVKHVTVIETSCRFIRELQPELFVHPKEQARFEVELEIPGKVTWFVNSMEIQPSSRYEMRIEQNTASLVVHDVTPADSGIYTCTFSAGDSIATSSCTLYVEEEAPLERPDEEAMLPSFVEKLSDVDAVDGSEICLTVRVAGHPVPELSWYCNNNNIDDNEDVVITYDRQTGYCKLLFVDVLPEDAGTYMCVASNPAGEVKTVCEMKVHPAVETMQVAPLESQVQEAVVQKPDRAEQRMSPEQLAGETQMRREYTQVVEQSGGEWQQTLLEAINIEKTSETITTYEETSGSSAREVPVDHGAEAIEIVSQQQRTQIVQRVGEQKFIVDYDEGLELYSPPKIVKPLQPIAAHEGSEAVFTCVITGEPAPDVRWLVNGQQLAQSDRISISYSEGTCILKISQVAPLDEAIYVLEATNTVGKATISANLVVVPPGAMIESSTTVVTRKQQDYVITGNQIIEDLTEVTESSPHFFQPLPEYLDVEEGSSLTIPCVAEGIPRPSLTWHRNGLVLEPLPRFTVSLDLESGETSLDISDIRLEDSGEYSVLAENPLGVATTKCIINVKTNQQTITTKETRTTTAVGGRTVTTDTIMTSMTSQNTEQISLQSKEVLQEGPKEQLRLVAPEFISQLTDLSIMDGDDAKFRCELNHDVYPLPNITWYHEDLEVEITKDMNVSFDSRKYICTLDISNVFPENAGLYRCVAQNDSGLAETSACLEIKLFEYSPDAEIASESSSVHESEEYVSVVEESETVTMEVKFITEGLQQLVSGKKQEEFLDIVQQTDIIPTTTVEVEVPDLSDSRSISILNVEAGSAHPKREKVTWYVDNDEVDEQFYESKVVDSTYSLVLPEVVTDDEAEYTVVAVNEHGRVSATAYLQVESESDEELVHDSALSQATKETPASIIEETSPNVRVPAEFATPLHEVIEGAIALRAKSPPVFVKSFEVVEDVIRIPVEGIVTAPVFMKSFEEAPSLTDTSAQQDASVESTSLKTICAPVEQVTVREEMYELEVMAEFQWPRTAAQRTDDESLRVDTLAEDITKKEGSHNMICMVALRALMDLHAVVGETIVRNADLICEKTISSIVDAF